MNPAEQEMRNWLAHPMEFGQPPEEIHEIHRERTKWPLFEERVELVFHRYRMADGFTGIGMTGPITWSFLGDDLSAFTMEELKRLYAGWYIAFAAINSPAHSRKQNKEQQRTLAERLGKEVEGFVDVEQYVSVGDLVFYAYRVKRGEKEFVIATDTEREMMYEQDSKYLRLPPLYYFLGDLFFEGYVS